MKHLFDRVSNNKIPIIPTGYLEYFELLPGKIKQYFISKNPKIKTKFLVEKDAYELLLKDIKGMKKKIEQ